MKTKQIISEIESISGIDGWQYSGKVEIENFASSLKEYHETTCHKMEFEYEYEPIQKYYKYDNHKFTLKQFIIDTENETGLCIAIIFEKKIIYFGGYFL